MSVLIDAERCTGGTMVAAGMTPSLDRDDRMLSDLAQVDLSTSENFALRTQPRNHYMATTQTSPTEGARRTPAI